MTKKEINELANAYIEAMESEEEEEPDFNDELFDFYDGDYWEVIDPIDETGESRRR